MKTWMIVAAIAFGTLPVAAQIDTIPVRTQIDTALQQLDTTTGQAARIPQQQGEILMDTIPTMDGFYQVNNLEDAVPFAYPEVNLKNIRFYKRVWRDIDLKDERNYIYAIPGNSLMEVIMKGIQAGKLTPYSPEDDSFKGKLSAKDGMARFADSVLVPIFDDEGNQIDSRMALNEFNPERVTKFRIKEDIFFDKQRGRLETRIIGVAPLMDITTSSELAASVGSTPAFWLYFPQLRYSLVKVDISDPDRGLYDMTMDDLFVQRKFASKIVRESSPGMLQQAKLAEEGALQTDNSQELEDKLEAYKKRLWTAPKGVNEKTLEGYEQDVKQAEEEERRRRQEIEESQRMQNQQESQELEQGTGTMEEGTETDS
ncbi:gliding motility associated protein GldN [Sphingobacterium allocomposti]|jgi:gliding motility associated protien GldN|uniref:Gliding motility associated protein GldN n=1 Tax=Sphingobacterium allocomposti TaxID=415956 RepID=A0A5S5CYM9_9SPHI|nr:gliding motility protein GldN [Sphingobacterium composti Yoo et al. 2007 non Ten et al. 2007]TYP88194.1 gliding motility associated protein GldN [Sphingobacterium composti Yoo et al. 2007 non Ten et al. 2007]